MPARHLLVAASLVLASCASDSPLDDPQLRPPTVAPASGPGVRATFHGNTTIHISDGTTDLLVDAFFSRPGAGETLLCPIGPRPEVIDPILARTGLDTPGALDAILIGHAHHDHTLDTAYVAAKTGALVMGNESYRQIHLGAGLPDDRRHLFTVPGDGTRKVLGKFTVTFIRSDHVTASTPVQKMVEGDIEEPLALPAHFSRFKCGQVYALHVAHEHGNILITTTAGACPGESRGFKADLVFLGVGRLDTETPARQAAYWKEYVETVGADLVVPVHWDSFTRPLTHGLGPAHPCINNAGAAMEIVKARAGRTRAVRVLDLGESVLLHRKRARWEPLGPSR